MKKIVLISSGQPSANPRAVKEATALSAAGYDVTFIYVPISPWADEFDRELIASEPAITWMQVGVHPLEQKRKYAFVRFRRKGYEVVAKAFPFLPAPAEYNYVLFAQELKKAALGVRADLYVAHNLGAVAAAVAAAKKWKTKAGFDAEDYHRGESEEGSFHNRQCIRIEQKYFPELSYLTAGSPLITDEYQRLFPQLPVTTINNVFSTQYLQQPAHGSAQPRLRLFWFSQTVGPNRGLENVVDAMNRLKDYEISLHLLGQCPEEYRAFLTNRASRAGALFFYSPLALSPLFEFASEFDIGLASEIPHNMNRDICLTNKIFTYLLAGNCVLASDTKAQSHFMKQYPGIGWTYRNGDSADLADKIQMLYLNRYLLENAKDRANKLAQTELNWEQESKKFLSIIRSTLNEVETPTHHLPSFSPV